MDITMNFTLGLTQGISWPWPIAVYLFLAGISGGAVAVAIMLNLYKKQTAQNDSEGRVADRRRDHHSRYGLPGC